MKYSKYDSLLQDLLRAPIFSAKEARSRGIPARMLSHFCQNGIIERVGRGIYKGAQIHWDIDFEWEDLALALMSIPKGVMCLISALCYYHLTDQIMREFWIAVPHTSKSPKREKVRIVRMRNIQLGLTEVMFGNYRLNIFNRERTIIDSFRFLSQEIAIKALQIYLYQNNPNKPDLNKLMKYAKSLRVNIHPFIMALTT